MDQAASTLHFIITSQPADTASQVRTEAAAVSLERTISLLNDPPHSFFVWRGCASLVGLLDTLKLTGAGLEIARNAIHGLVVCGPH